MKKKLFIVLAFVGMFFVANAQVEKAQALFIYNFTRLIEWPASTSNEFVIGVFGNGNIHNELETFTKGKKAGTQNIVIKRISSTEEAKGCQIVYVTSSKSSKMQELTSVVNNSNILLVGEKAGLVNSGAAINFLINGNKLTFELNSSNAQKYGLKVSTALKNMAHSNS